MQNFSLHTHTIGFDGRHSPAEMIDAARAIGIGTLGISNHFTVHPDIKHSNTYPYSVRGGYEKIYSDNFDSALDKFMPLFNDLSHLDGRGGVRVLRGAEVDFFQYPHWRAGFDDAMRKLRPDYIIGSVHFIEYNGKLYNMHDLEREPSYHKVNEMLRLYWAKIRAAAASGLFNIMAHLDLPKKVGLGRDIKWAPYEMAAMDAIADTGCIVELNTSQFAKLGEPYPSRRILNMAVERNVPLILSDDAHRVENIGINFDATENWARGCGAKNFVEYQKVLDFSHSGR